MAETSRVCRSEIPKTEKGPATTRKSLSIIPGQQRGVTIYLFIDRTSCENTHTQHKNPDRRAKGINDGSE